MTTPAAAAPSDDLALLHRYGEHGSPEAFATVVGRHADFIFATALRQTRDRDLAEDVTQATFIVLARRARSLRAGTSVAAFLHQTAVYAAKNAVRAKQRRRRHEGAAALDPATPAAAAAAAAAREPFARDDDDAVAVDRALVRLGEADRHLLMLHYFDGLTIAEAAARLAISHEAARKRLHRALERLRAKLRGDGVNLAADALPAAVAAMAQSGVEAAAATIASTAVAGGAGGSAFALASEVLRSFQMLALKKAAAAIAVAATVSAGAVIAVTQAWPRDATHAAATPPTAARTIARPLPQPARNVESHSLPAGPPATTRVVVRRAPVIEPPGTYIIDYAAVFDALQQTRDERARLDALTQDMQRERAARIAKIADLRKQVGAATEPAARAKLQGELQAAAREDEQILRAAQANLQREQGKRLLELFQQVEGAIPPAAAAEGVTLPPDAFRPYPANIGGMRIDRLREYLNNQRRLRRPPGTPDLTNAVLKQLEPHLARRAVPPSTKPSRP